MSVVRWAVNRPHRIGPWWLCIRCLITGERPASADPKGTR